MNTFRISIFITLACMAFPRLATAHPGHGAELRVLDPSPWDSLLAALHAAEHLLLQQWAEWSAIFPGLGSPLGWVALSIGLMLCAQMIRSYITSKVSRPNASQ